MDGTSHITPWVFHRNGQPIGNFRKAWNTASKKAGLAGRVFHDLRRSGIRLLVQSWVDQATIMSISGHRTIHTFLRYNIVNQDDRSKALMDAQAHLETHPKEN